MASWKSPAHVLSHVAGHLGPRPATLRQWLAFRSKARFVGEVLILPDHAKENVANPGDDRPRRKRPDTLRFGSIMRGQLYRLG
jgi:hypothetical protein